MEGWEKFVSLQVQPCTLLGVLHSHIRERVHHHFHVEANGYPDLSWQDLLFYASTDNRNLGAVHHPLLCPSASLADGSFPHFAKMQRLIEAKWSLFHQANQSCEHEPEEGCLVIQPIHMVPKMHLEPCGWGFQKAKGFSYPHPTGIQWKLGN